MTWAHASLYLFPLLKAGAVFHAIRSGEAWWIWVIVFVPFGEFVYAASVLMPSGGGVATRVVPGKDRRSTRELRYVHEQNPSLQNAVALADRLLDEGGFTEAEGLYADALRRDAAYLRAHYGLAICRSEARDPEGALEHWRVVVDASRSYEEYGDGCDWVLTRDEHNPYGPLVQKRVLRLFVRVAPVRNLHVGGRVIRTTAEHPFWVLGRGWLAAGFLQAGDVVLSHDDRLLAVEAVTESGEVTTVYNLEVEGCHTYFVGCQEWGFSVWAHNATKLYTRNEFLRQKGHVKWVVENTSAKPNAKAYQAGAKGARAGSAPALLYR